VAEESSNEFNKNNYIRAWQG